MSTLANHRHPSESWDLPVATRNAHHAKTPASAGVTG
jgi:hypothetical protein